MKISVIVVTRNEGAELRRTVENLRDTLPGRSEIVIVDDASTDGSTARFRRAIKAGGIGVARARNLGAAQSKGDLLVFADGHIRLDKMWWLPRGRLRLALDAEPLPLRHRKGSDGPESRIGGPQFA